MYREIKPQEGTGAPRAPLTCHCEERSDVAISQYPAASWESYQQKRNCLSEIATGAERPRNDKLGGHCLFNIGPHFPPVQCRARLSPPLQRTNGNFPLPSRSVPTHNVINIFVLWKKHKNPRGNPKRSLIIPSRRDLTNAGKCDKIKAQRESGAFKNTDPVFGIARQDRFVADRLGTPAFAAGAPFFFRRGREENQNV